MKKLYSLLIITLVSSYLNSNAQTVNKIPIVDLDAEYIEVVGCQKLLDNSIVIEIDYGQKTNAWGRSKQFRDSTGRKMEFNSMIDALNYLTNINYEFVQAYAYANSRENVTRYLLRKKRRL